MNSMLSTRVSRSFLSVSRVGSSSISPLIPLAAPLSSLSPLVLLPIRHFSEDRPIGPDPTKFKPIVFPPPRPFRQKLNKLYDFAHRSIVFVFLGVTVAGIAYSSAMAWDFHKRAQQVMVEKPEQVMAFLKEKAEKKVRDTEEKEREKEFKAVEVRNRLGLKELDPIIAAEAAKLKGKGNNNEQQQQQQEYSSIPTQKAK